MKNINKIKDDIYREIVERTVDGGEYSDEELYELIEEKVLKKSHEVYIAQSEKESITKVYTIPCVEWMCFRNL